MTARPGLTRREQLLLEAVCQVLDLPAPAGYDDMLARDDQQTERVYWLLGCLTDLPNTSAATILKVLGHMAADPLRYTAETPEQTAARRARSASSANEVPGLSHG